LSRLSGVPRWKVNAWDIGDVELSDDELTKIRAALRGEIERLRNLSVSVDLDPVAAPDKAKKGVAA